MADGFSLPVACATTYGDPDRHTIRIVCEGLNSLIGVHILYVGVKKT